MKRGDDTKKRILDAGLKLVREGGLRMVTQRGIGIECDCSHTNVRYYFATVPDLREAVVAEAIERKDQRALARLVMDDHPAMRAFSRKQRQALIASVASSV